MKKKNETKNTWSNWFSNKTSSGHSWWCKRASSTEDNISRSIIKLRVAV